MTCRALPRTAEPVFPLVWLRWLPPVRPLPRPCDCFALGPLLILYELKLIPSFEVLVKPPMAIADRCPNLRTPSLDDWFGSFAVSSQLLVAQHSFAISDHSTKCSPRHAFNSSSSAFASIRSAVSKPSVNHP